MLAVHRCLDLGPAVDAVDIARQISWDLSWGHASSPPPFPSLQFRRRECSYPVLRNWRTPGRCGAVMVLIIFALRRTAKFYVFGYY